MAAAVSRIEVATKRPALGDGHIDTVVRLWFWNKMQALELLFKHLGLMEPQVEERPAVPVYLLPAGARVATK